MQKNVASQKWTVFAFGLPDHANPGQPVTGDAANITANIKIDGGAAAGTNDTNPTELEDGFYEFDLTQAETNGDLLRLFPASSTANVQVIALPQSIYTRPANFNALGIAADGDLSGNVDGSVASVAGAVGSVTGNVGGIAGTIQTLDALDTAQDTQHAATRTDIGNLNNLSAAQVNAEVDTALADYDPPTKAELDAGLAGLNDPTAAAIADAVLDEATAGHTTAGTFGKAISDTKSDTAAILEDTGTTIPATLSTLATAAALATVDTVVDAIKATTDNLPDSGALTSIAQEATLAALNDISVADVLTTQMTESYAADGVAPTLTQALLLIQQVLTEKAIAGTTMTIKQLDGSTTAATCTLDDATSPTSITRSA